MKKYFLTAGADYILKHMVRANSNYKATRGTDNLWTAPLQPGPNLQQLIDNGLVYADGEIRPLTGRFRATLEGMRVAGLSPREIERCSTLTPAAPELKDTAHDA